MDCGYKFRLSRTLEEASKPSLPIRGAGYHVVKPSSVLGKGIWITIAIVLLILGMLMGVGIGLMRAPLKPSTTTITKLFTKSITLAKTIHPLTVTSVCTVTKFATVVMTKTVTMTTTPKPPPGCEITSAKVVMKSGIPYLYVKFKTTVTASIKLIGPDGEEKSVDLVSPEETATYLRMSRYGETPLPGKYKVILRSLFGKLAEKEFEFTRYNVKATKIEFEKEWHEGLGYGSLTGVVIYLTNEGDLPTYVIKAKVVIDGDMKTVSIYSRPVPPGTSSLKISVLASMKPGSYTIEVTLVNDEEKEIAAIKGTLTFP